MSFERGWKGGLAYACLDVVALCVVVRGFDRDCNKPRVPCRRVPEMRMVCCVDLRQFVEVGDGLFISSEIDLVLPSNPPCSRQLCT